MPTNNPIQLLEKSPQHVAFIMDGNLRWAKKNGVSSVEGLHKGFGVIRPTVNRAIEYGIPWLSFWALSTDNWRKRGQTFTNIIMDLMREKLQQSGLFDDLRQQGAELHVLGDITAFPEDIQMLIQTTFSKKPDTKRIDINVGLNYGGRAEILRGIRSIISEQISEEEITAELFSSFLYTANQPDPDLIVRTGYHQRLSGFFAWQAEYAEYYFPQMLWPDFDENEFDAALKFYSEEDRNFGGVSKGFADYINDDKE